MPTEVTRDAPPKPQAPIDTNVRLPDSVRRAAAAADAFYANPPAPPQPEPPQPEPPQPEPPQPEPPQPEPPKAPKAPKAPEPPQPEPPQPGDQTVTPDQWEHRFRSMKGRYDAQIQINSQMQEQMGQLGDELVRTQQMLQQNYAQPNQPNTPKTFLTPEDAQNYGTDLIDLTKRAAMDAVAPKLNELEQENQQLRQRVNHQSQMGVVQTLDMKVPNWREINRDPNFKRWLSLRDIYSGVVRKQMLDAAYQAADAPRVLAFFTGFVQDEEIVAGNAAPAPQSQPVSPPPRQPAVPLERLAAPGRARPAGGNDAPNVPADKPTFTRQQIKGFYDDVRRGVYAGREADKASREREIFAAQSEGRVR